MTATAQTEIVVGTGHPSSWRPTPREFDWPQIGADAPVLAATMVRYLDQIALSLQPSSVKATDGILRRFAGYRSGSFLASTVAV